MEATRYYLLECNAGPKIGSSGFHFFCKANTLLAITFHTTFISPGEMKHFRTCLNYKKKFTRHVSDILV